MEPVNQLLEKPTTAAKVLNLFVIYNSPVDFPGLYVARLWKTDKPTNYYIAAAQLSVLRSLLPKDLICMQRHEEDDPCIVEVWM